MTDHEVRTLMIAVAEIKVMLENLEEKVDNLNGFRDWAIRLVIGAVILGLLGMLWAQGK